MTRHNCTRAYAFWTGWQAIGSAAMMLAMPPLVPPTQGVASPTVEGYAPLPVRPPRPPRRFTDVAASG